jgi:hypothetical protein
MVGYWKLRLVMNSLRRKRVDLIRQSINEPAMMALALGSPQNEEVAWKHLWKALTSIKDGQSQNHSSAQAVDTFRINFVSIEVCAVLAILTKLAICG